MSNTIGVKPSFAGYPENAMPNSLLGRADIGYIAAAGLAQMREESLARLAEMTAPGWMRRFMGRVASLFSKTHELSKPQDQVATNQASSAKAERAVSPRVLIKTSISDPTLPFWADFIPPVAPSAAATDYSKPLAWGRPAAHSEIPAVGQAGLARLAREIQEVRATFEIEEKVDTPPLL